MKNLKVILAITLIAGTSMAFAVAPVPGYVNLETGEIAGFVHSPWSVANYGLMPQRQETEVSGFQPQPWSVERSAYFVRDTQVAEVGNDNDRGRL